MDWADDITYAIHDMIDFYCAGLIPLHLLAGGGKGGDLGRREWAQFFDATCASAPKIAKDRDRYEDALERAIGLAGLDGPFTGSQSQSSTIWRFSSVLISQYVNAIRLVSPSEAQSERHVGIRSAARDETTILKQLTWHYVIRRSDLATVQYGQKAVIQTLFEVYEKAIREKRSELLPVWFFQLVRSDDSVSASRWAADYISGLTERQVIDCYRRLCGYV
jgi:dGTPase